MSATETDSLTVFRTPALWMAKRIWPDRTESYSRAKFVDLFTVPLPDGLDDIAALLARMAEDPRAGVLRGAVICPDRTTNVRRLLYTDRKTGDTPTLQEIPRSWVALDIENVTRPDQLPASDLAGCAVLALRHLPTAFTGPRCIVQATSSHAIKPDIRLRLWFWLNRPTTGSELKRWLEGTPADPSIFGAAQPIYTARPIFMKGAVDPLAARMVEIPGISAVQVPSKAALAPPPRRAAVATSESVSDEVVREHVDRALNKLRGAADGEKHNALRAAARTIGGYQAQAGFSTETAIELLIAALPHGVEDENGARNTARWGIEHGYGHPLPIRAPSRQRWNQVKQASTPTAETSPKPEPEPPLPPDAIPAEPDAPTLRWCAAVMIRALARLGATPEGDRHLQLRSAAYTIGGIMDAMGINPTTAAKALLEAARIDASNEAAVALIYRSISRGRLAPMSMERNHHA